MTFAHETGKVVRPGSTIRKPHASKMHGECVARTGLTERCHSDRLAGERVDRSNQRLTSFLTRDWSRAGREQRFRDPAKRPDHTSIALEAFRAKQRVYSHSSGEPL